MKPGTIIENYQGRFAKVVSASDGRYGLTAFVAKKSDAEKETVVTKFLNEFGLGQIVAETKKTTPKKTDQKDES